MSWIRAFLVGLLTENLGTKFLALLLAIIVFVFAEQQGRGTREVEELLLELRLDDELTDRYVLLHDEVRLKDIEIEGKKTVVDRLAQAWSSDKVIQVTITSGMIYADPQPIEINKTFFRDMIRRHYNEDVRLSEDPRVPLVRYAPLVAYPVRIVPAEGTNFRLDPAGNYRPAGGDTLQLRFSVENIELRGPNVAFEKEPRNLQIKIPDLDEYLRDKVVGPEVRLHLAPGSGSSEIKWKASGVNPSYYDLIQVAVNGETMSALAFEESLEILFRVRARQKQETVPFPIVLRQGKKTIDLTQWSSLGGLVTNKALKEWRADAVPVKMPGAVAKSDLLSKLVLVLDLSNASEKPNSLDVPIFLAFAHHADATAANLALLEQIELVSETREQSFEKLPDD